MKDIPLYKTRSTKRGLLLAFSFIEFKNNIEKYRRGAEVDCKNLKYLFNEIGFPKVIFYNNLTRPVSIFIIMTFPLKQRYVQYL